MTGYGSTSWAMIAFAAALFGMAFVSDEENHGWLFGWSLGFLFVGLILAAVSSDVADERAFKARRTAYMARCLQDHRDYECDSLWASIAAQRAAESADIAASVAMGASMSAAIMSGSRR